MALRIAGAKKAAPPVEEDPQAQPQDTSAVDPEMDPNEQEPDGDADDSQDQSQQPTGVVDPTIAGYMGPENGPFKCGNCIYFGIAGPNSCELVAGQIDEEGCCNLFTPGGAAQGPDQGQQPPDDESQEQQPDDETQEQ